MKDDLGAINNNYEREYGSWCHIINIEPTTKIYDEKVAVNTKRLFIKSLYVCNKGSM